VAAWTASNCSCLFLLKKSKKNQTIGKRKKKKKKKLKQNMADTAAGGGEAFARRMLEKFGWKESVSSCNIVVILF
jgi:excinuclease UvrABC nuclease subunit